MEAISELKPLGFSFLVLAAARTELDKEDLRDAVDAISEGFLNPKGLEMSSGCRFSN